jgi:hypothetical protein
MRPERDEAGSTATSNHVHISSCQIGQYTDQIFAPEGENPVLWPFSLGYVLPIGYTEPHG